MPKLTDINQFASLVDPRQPDFKKKKVPRNNPERVRRTNPAEFPGYSTQPGSSVGGPEHRRTMSLIQSNDLSSYHDPGSADKLAHDVKPVARIAPRANKTIQSPIREQHPKNNFLTTTSSMRMADQQRQQSWNRPQPMKRTIEALAPPLNTAAGKTNAPGGTADSSFPKVAVKRQTMTAGEAKQEAPKDRNWLSQSRVSGQGNTSAFTWANNQQPTRQVLAEQRAAEARLQPYKRGARQYESSIEKILQDKTMDWTSLYQHPKLMGHYYWKSD